MEHAPTPHLTELVDNGFVAAVLAATERVCIAASTVFSGASHAHGPAWLDFDTYRIVAVHDRARLAARVAEDTQRFSERGEPRTICDIVESVVIADVFEYGFYREDVAYSTHDVLALRRAVEDQRTRPHTLVEQCYTSTARTYDDLFDPAAHIALVRPERPGTVRCTVLFPAIYSATAEYLAHVAPERVFCTGEDIVADAAVARYLAEYGTIALDRLDTWLRSKDEAVLALYGHVVGMDLIATPTTPLNSLITNTPIGWFTSLRAPLDDNALLTESGARYLLGRAGELAASRIG